MIQVALVGCAHIHTPGFANKMKERPDVAVKWVWDHDAARAEKYATDLGAPKTENLSSVWTDPEIDAVAICSETNRHESLVLPAAKAKKHLFVEKPLGMGAKDAWAMARAIEEAGVLFQTGYAQRGDPIHQFLRAQIAKGSFGRVTRVRHSNCHSGSLGRWFDTDYRWMADPKIAGCGAFGDLGTHSLDILLWLMGDVVSATASVAVAVDNYDGCDEFGEGLLKFANGAVGTLASGWVDVANPVRCLISGTEGHAHVVSGHLYFQSAKVEGADGKEPWRDLPEPWPHAFDLFLDAVGGKKNLPLVTVREAAMRSAVMEAMYEGAKQGRWVAPVTG
ncbi:MAG TPA: Gfo/Idh/MocA family oxidoreductase [Sumerlaeia bacterium]|nr:Gfo/Idh/MocA family oxidoreductase [Sumerlaeia bacterium]